MSPELKITPNPRPIFSVRKTTSSLPIHGTLHSPRVGRCPSPFVPPSRDSRARSGNCQLPAPRTSESAEFDAETTPHRAFLRSRKLLRSKALELLLPGEKPLCAPVAQKNPKTR